MAVKNVYIILAFHAHEPWWDLTKHVLASLHDEELAGSVPSENWVQKRALAGRDVYTHLIDLSKQLKAPMCLEATNELLMQIGEFQPETLASIQSAFAGGSLYPIYGGAHHAHCSLLTTDELADELRLNQEFLHDVLGAPLPRYRGAFPMEGSVDARKLEAFARAGIDYLVFPNLSPRKAHYTFDRTANPPYEPFALEQGLIGLPRHFGISQDIWRPITRWKPGGLRLQGYILGLYPVFDEEYREQRSVTFPITRREAIDDYRRVLEHAITEAPDGGLLLYIQDLELMDYGDEALEILAEALPAVRVPDARVHVVTPDEYIERTGVAERDLPRMRFFQVSWAPEIRPVLRADGHYPPLDAGPIDGVDFSTEGFRRWPFIFWEWGRWHIDIVNTLLSSFEFPLVQPLSAHDWWERAYKNDQLTTPERIALLSRTMKQADNWGWQPDEDRQKRPYLYLLAIIHQLMRDRTQSNSVQPFNPRSLEGLEWLLKPYIDVRVDYLRRGIEKLDARAGEHVHWAHIHLQRAEERRAKAQTAIEQAGDLNRRLADEEGSRGAPVEGLLQALAEHCRHVFLGTDDIQRAWGSVADTNALVVEMYRYLYDMYPPLLFGALQKLAPQEELVLVEDPPLL